MSEVKGGERDKTKDCLQRRCTPIGIVQHLRVTNKQQTSSEANIEQEETGAAREDKSDGEVVEDVLPLHQRSVKKYIYQRMRRSDTTKKR